MACDLLLEPRYDLVEYSLCASPPAVATSFVRRTGVSYRRTGKNSGRRLGLGLRYLTQRVPDSQHRKRVRLLPAIHRFRRTPVYQRVCCAGCLGRNPGRCFNISRALHTLWRGSGNIPRPELRIRGRHRRLDAKPRNDAYLGAVHADGRFCRTWPGRRPGSA